MKLRKWGISLFKLFQLLIAGGAIILFFSIVSNRKIIDNARPYLFDSVSEIPVNNVGLVLGTSKYSGRGRINNYFKFRMEATAKLYKNGKIKYIVVSGDNHKHGYNEPQQMKEYLMNLGVPENRIFLDFAGFRTFDSVIRIKEIFGQNKVTIISQKFHNERAVFLARKNDIEAIAFNAKMPWYSRQMKTREYLAKCKAVLDVYLLKTKPKFLGEKIEIPL